MLRSLRISFLLAVVVMAAGASSASAASFRSETAPEYLLGQQVESTRFRFPSTHFGEFFLEPICKKGNALGETTALTTATAQIFPSYEECTSQALAVKIEMNGCGYALTPTGLTTASLSLVCQVGKEVVIRFFSGLEICRIMIAAQTPESGLELVNEGTPKFVRFAGTVKGIKYTTFNVPGSSNCEKAASNAEIVFNSTIKGYSDAARTKQVGFRVE